MLLVGLYTSPHLKDFRERIKINGKKISENYVVDFVTAHQNFFTNQHFSFFEMTVWFRWEIRFYQYRYSRNFSDY